MKSPLTKQNITDIVCTAIGHPPAKIIPRGKSSVFFVEFLAQKKLDPDYIASTFLTKIPPSQNRDFWCSPDRPIGLRTWESNAFKLGVDYKKNSTRAFLIIEGFLVIDMLVVGPVNLIPVSEEWPALEEAIDTAFKNPFTFNASLSPEKQLRHSSLTLIAELSGPSFVDPQESPDWMDISTE